MQGYHHQVKITNQVRRLTQILFASAALNVILLLAFLSLLYLESPLLPFPSHSHTLSSTLVNRGPLPDLRVPTSVKPIEPPSVIPSPIIAVASHINESAPKMVPVVKPTPSVKTVLPYVTYVVLDGDSLWKIARKYGVDVTTLKQVNHLEGDRLKQGMVLSIPVKKPLLSSNATAGVR